MRDKKGSMELGINAIVVLIIALVILGLGIGFVTRLFTQSSDTFGGIIASQELEFHADAMNAIKFDTTEATVKKGATSAIKVSVYNSGIFAENSPITLSVTECIDANGNLYTDACDSGMISACLALPPSDPLVCDCHLRVVKLAAPSQPITPGTDGGYRAILSVPKTYYGDLQDLAAITAWMNDRNVDTEKVKAQTYICTIKASDSTVDNPKIATSQLYIKVIV
jgi:hypothetical protein